VAVASCVFIVHDVGYVLRVSYWVDEAWVADSTRTSIGHLLLVTSATPIGWTYLLRLMPSSNPQDLRLLPLLFAAGAVLAAYELGRSLRLLPIVSGVLAGGAALLVPAMLVRDDLKEYTADTFVVLLALALVSRLEAAWSRRRLIILAVALMASALVSHVALLVAAAALPAVAIAQLLRRRRREFLEAAVVTGATGAILGVIYLTLDGGIRTASLHNYWKLYYLPRHLIPAVRTVDQRFHALLPMFGIHNAILLAVLVFVGLAVLVWQGRWATAAVLPIVWFVVVALGWAQRYPIGDLRKSTFIITSSVVVAAIGLAGVATLVARHVHVVAGVALAGAVAALYIHAVVPYVRSHPIPVEDVRAQEAYVSAHARPGDIVLVNDGASYAYAYYAKPRPIVFPQAGIGFAIKYPTSDNIRVLDLRAPADVRAGMANTLALMAKQPGAGLWIVRNHQPADEVAAWKAVLAPIPHREIVVPPSVAGEAPTTVDYVPPGR